MRRQRITVVAAAAAFMLTVAACSSSGDGSESPSASSGQQGEGTTGAGSQTEGESPASSDTGASSNSGGESNAEFSGEPLKIGFLDTMTGGNGNVGQLNLQGAQIAADQWNEKGGVLGRKVELVVKDEELSPDKTVQHMREFASDDINLITGFTSSADVLAAKPLAEQNDQVIVTAGATDTSLTSTEHSDNVYEVAANIHMMNVATAHLAGTEWSGVKKWDGVAYDYVTGHDAWDEFGGLLGDESPDATVGKAVFPPLSSTQDTAFINSLLATNPDPKTSGLYYFLFGGGAVQFAKQAHPLDLFKQYDTVVGFASGEEFSSALGADGPPITFVHDYFYQGYDNPTNKYFIDQWKTKDPISGLNLYGPHEWSYEGYTAVTALLSAVKDAGSTDTDAVKKSLSSIEFDSPMGKVHFHKSNILAAPVTVWQCHGDADAKFGYTCGDAESVPPSVTLKGYPDNVTG